MFHKFLKRSYSSSGLLLSLQKSPSNVIIHQNLKSFCHLNYSSSFITRTSKRGLQLYKDRHPYSTSNKINNNNGNNNQDSSLRTTIWFSIQDEVGALDKVLGVLKPLKISLTRIESRPSKSTGFYDFYIDFNAESDTKVQQVEQALINQVDKVKVVSTGEEDTKEDWSAVPWFPRKISDLDTFAEKVLSYGAELEADHPGFKDPLYRQRRAEITNLAKSYKHGDRLPRIQYDENEVKTWGIVFDKLADLYKSHACREHQYVFPLLVQNCGYSRDNIPQLEDISRFMKECTGWTIRPVMGLLSSRDFLNALAFRVFHSTQYIRHHSEPLYTPEPDICHELLGHVPLFADSDFADFSHEIGLASLGATAEDIQKLATIYWFTVEFGLCRQGGEIKAFGAGLLSSFGELEYSLSDKSKKTKFVPEVAAVTKYPITEYQPLYFVAESFRDMKEQVKDYAVSLKRPFSVRYNALTESVEVLDSKEKLLKYAQGIQGDMTRLVGAIEKLRTNGE